MHGGKKIEVEVEVSWLNAEISESKKRRKECFFSIHLKVKSSKWNLECR